MAALWGPHAFVQRQKRRLRGLNNVPKDMLDVVVLGLEPRTIRFL